MSIPDYKEAFDLCYDHLCDLMFCVQNTEIPTAAFQESIIAEIGVTAMTNDLFIAKKKQDDEL